MENMFVGGFLDVLIGFCFEEWYVVFRIILDGWIDILY